MSYLQSMMDGSFAPPDSNSQMPTSTVIADPSQLQQQAVAQQGFQHGQGNVRTSASSPALNHHGDPRLGLRNVNPTPMGPPNQQNRMQAPVAYMHISQRPGQPPVPSNNAMSPNHMPNASGNMDMMSPSAIARANLLQHLQARGVHLPGTPPAMAIPNHGSLSQKPPVQGSQQTQAAVSGKTIPSPIFQVDGATASNNRSKPSLNLNSQQQGPTGVMQRPQAGSPGTNQSSAMMTTATRLPSNLSPSLLPQGHPLAPFSPRRAQPSSQQISTHSRQPLISPGPSQVRSSTPALGPANRNATASPFLDHDGYSLSQKDRERLRRQHLLNNSTPSSLPRPMSAPILRVPSALGKHPLDVSALDCNEHGAPPSKKVFLMPSVVPSQRRSSDGTARRLTLEAAKHGAGHLNIQSTSSHGRINTIESTNAPTSSRKGTPLLPTPAWTTEMQGSLTQAPAGRERGDSGVGMEVVPAEDEPGAELVDGDGVNAVKDKDALKTKAERDGVHMTDVENGTRIKQIVDSMASFPRRFEHLPHLSIKSRSHNTSTSSRSHPSLQKSPVTLLPFNTPAISMPQVLAKVRSPSYSYAFSEHEGVALPPLGPVDLENCWVDREGVLRAPEERGMSVERVAVLSALMDVERCGRGRGEWVEGEDGEWVRKVDVRKEEDGGLELHRRAFEGLLRRGGW